MFKTSFIKGVAIIMNVLITVCFVSVKVDAQGGPAKSPVKLTETDQLYILDNGIVIASIAKTSGDIVSLNYDGKEMFATILDSEGKPDLQADPPGENLNGLNRGMTDHQYGFWSHDAMGRRESAQAAIAKITIDPKNNNGQRAEVSVKGLSNGTRQLGTGPGASRGDGDFYADVEIRYTMNRGDPGVYTYCIFEHKPDYPADTITEARFCMKLNDFFDWMLNDAKRNKLYPKTDRENKYNYTANQFENRAFGWASTTENVGCFLINASMEYMSGGPTKVEFLCHRDTNQIAAPCVLNYWRSSHYGGAMVAVAAGEEWTKVIGPLMIYCNRGNDPQTILHDAQARQAAESTKWPYSWVDAPAYPNAYNRGTLKGRLVLNDPLMPGGAKMTNIMVGLTRPDYEIQGNLGSRMVSWQQDAKYYQFWVRGNDDGTFSIPNVNPGTYTLRAYADGILGEFTMSDVIIEAGKTLDIGSLLWAPVRYGRQLWDIGIPNRNSREFLKGDDYYHDGMQELYAELFPNDVNYVIGKSDYAKDIYFQHVPHAIKESLEAASGAQRSLFFAPRINGAATPWKISFDMPQAPTSGKATLRLAISGTGARTINVKVNEQNVGDVALSIGDSTFAGRNGIQGIWYERKLAFDATMLKTGTNIIVLTVPAGAVGNGVMYDYLRLELSE